jgi:protein SCO1
MKKNIIAIVIFSLLILSCKQEEIELNTTPVSEESIFNLTSKWKDQDNKTLEIKDFRGKVSVMVMIYTSCKAACPRLVADMRDIESKIPKEELKNLNFILVSIDPITDTPEKLKVFAKDNFMEASHWNFLQGTPITVQEFANVLAVKYKKITPVDFSHSNIISVFNREGELVHQQEGLGVNNEETIDKILETVKSN